MVIEELTVEPKGYPKMKVWGRPGTSDERVLKEVLVQNTYRKSSIGFDVEKGERWLDLGANIGAFALYCWLRGAKAECWEPEPKCFDILERNVGRHNGFSLHRSAVSARDSSELQFYKGKSDEDHYRYSLINSSRPHMVLPNTYAYGLFNRKEWDGVKMDIEGAELELIDENLIPTCKKLVMEYHLTKDNCMANFRKRMKKLKKHFNTVSYIPSLDQPYPNDKYPGFYDRVVFCMK